MTTLQGFLSASIIHHLLIIIDSEYNYKKIIFMHKGNNPVANLNLSSLLEQKNEIEILRIGRYLETDEEGYLISLSDSEKIPPKWKEAVEDMIQAYVDNLGKDNVHSIVVKGSVSRGEPIEGVSDIDTYAICRDVSIIDPSWIKQAKTKQQNRYLFIDGFEFILWSLDKVQNPNSINIRFGLKTQAATVYGEDLIPGIERYKPDVALAKCLVKGFSDDLAIGNESIRRVSTVEQLRGRCRWITKRLLRKGFYLVMPREQRFTRDLYPSYESFVKHYPEKEREMYTALYLAINPTSDKEALLNYTSEFGTWLQNEIQEGWFKHEIVID